MQGPHDERAPQALGPVVSTVWPAYAKEIEVTDRLWLTAVYAPGDLFIGILLRKNTDWPSPLFSLGWGYDLPKWPIRPWPTWGPDTTDAGHTTWTLMWLGFCMSRITPCKSFIDQDSDCGIEPT